MFIICNELCFKLYLSNIGVIVFCAGIIFFILSFLGYYYWVSPFIACCLALFTAWHCVYVKARYCQLSKEGFKNQTDVLGVDFSLAPLERTAAAAAAAAPSRAEPSLLARLAAAAIQSSVEDDNRIFHGHGHALGKFI